MTSYSDILQKKRQYKSKFEHVPTANREADHQSVHVKRKKETSRIETPVNPSELSSEDRKLLLQKRISQLEENDRYIYNLQLEMANNAREKSRNSDHSYSTDAGSRRVSETGTYVISRDSHEIGRKDSFTSIPIPEEDIDTSNYDKYRYLSDIRTKNVQNVRKADRNYRRSVLDKAERLLIERRLRSRGRNRANIIKNAERILEDRKAREYTTRLNDSDNERPQKQRNPNHNTLNPNVDYVETRSRSPRSPRSEDEFVEVPEYVDSDSSSTVRAYSLPPPPRTQKSLRSDIPSAAQVCKHSIHFSPVFTRQVFFKV